MKVTILLATTTCVVFITFACDKPASHASREAQSSVGEQYSVSVVRKIVRADSAPLLMVAGDVQVYQGLGSGLAPVPGSTSDFYLLTDRGPNVDGGSENMKLFLMPSYSPRIYMVHLSDGALRVTGEIILRREDGTPLTGIPIPTGSCGSTPEDAHTMSGAAVRPDPYGIDSEGIVALQDGTFWVSDEYGPFLLHFGADGREIERLTPCKGGLPEVYKLRRPNRGMEGLTITPDGEWLVGIMQAPLENPASEGVRNISRLARILFRNITTGAMREYAYILEDSTIEGNSEITALSPTRFLVIERDRNFPSSAPAAAIKKVFEIDITGATDISAQGALGARPIAGGKTLEQGTLAEVLAVATPVTKNVVVDLLKLGYPHDKAEGLAVTAGGYLLVSNDNDFGVAPSEIPGRIKPKILPATGRQDFLSIWEIRRPR